MDAAMLKAVERKIAQLASDGGKNGVDSKFREAKSFNDRTENLLESPSSGYMSSRFLMGNWRKMSDDDITYLHMNMCLQIRCEWKNYDSRMKKLSDMVDKFQTQKNRKNRPLPPMDLHSATCIFGLSLDQQLRLATYISQLGAKVPIAPTIDYGLISTAKLRIGYICTGMETFPLVGDRCRHNSDRFEVFHYWFADDPTLLKAVGQGRNDHVINLSGMVDDSKAAANRIASDGIQILVSLDNIFDVCEELNAILSQRPAPIQVVYRTVLGSTGASYMDYFITDKVASPLQFANGYSEKLAYMPNGMFVNSDPNDLNLIKLPEELENRAKVRRRFGLPASGIVYGVKSHSYQIDPETFSCWCEILRGVPGSVLWMPPAYVPELQMNLETEAKRHKINRNRLVFATDSKVEDPTNLVDVVLDTPMCNSYAVMASICGGIPIVTLPKESFPSRLTASMLTSVNCGELIAKSKFEYVQMAVNLGNKPDLLAEMRAKMREILPNSNLFATDRYFGDLENLYEKMWKWREMGEKPEHLVCGNPFPLPCLL